MKEVIQLPTYNAVNAIGNPFVLGAYYGVQTMVLEVGLAYLIAYFAVKRRRLDRRDAEAYGSALAFWENVGLLSILSLVNLVAYSFILSSGGSLADLTYNQLTTNAPGLFASNSVALANVGLGVLERLSSAMIHIAWGYLCVMAVLYRKKKLFLIALPMGLIDFLVSFVPVLGTVLFEVTIFALATVSLFVAWYSTKELGKRPEGASWVAPPTNEGSKSSISPTGN